MSMVKKIQQEMSYMLLEALKDKVCDKETVTEASVKIVKTMAEKYDPDILGFPLPKVELQIIEDGTMVISLTYPTSNSTETLQ